MDREFLKSKFTKIYNGESDPLFRYIFLRVSSREESLNILQDAFLKLWNLMQESEVDHPKAFLYKVARNMIVDWYRKKKPVSLDEMTDNYDGEAFDIKDESIDGKIFNDAETSIVLKGLKQLPKDYSEAVYLRFMEGLDPKDIAAILNESPNVVSVRISRGLTQLRKILNVN